MRKKKWIVAVVIAFILAAAAVIVLKTGKEEVTLETDVSETPETSETLDSFLDGDISLDEYAKSEVEETSFTITDKTGTKSDLEMESYAQDVEKLADSFNKTMLEFNASTPDYTSTLLGFFGENDSFNEIYKDSIVCNIWQVLMATNTETVYTNTESLLLEAEEVDGQFCLHLTCIANFQGKSDLFDNGSYSLYEKFSFYNLDGWKMWAFSYGEVYPKDSFAFSYDEGTGMTYTKGSVGMEWAFSTPEKYTSTEKTYSEIEQYAMQNNLYFEMYEDGSIVWKDMDGNVVEGPQP